MANPIIYRVTMPSGNTYDLVDQGARDLIKELLNFHEWLGITTSDIDDGSTTNPVIIEGEPVTAVAGDVVSRDSDHRDFVYSSTGIWQNFGGLSGLGALAFQDDASGTYTPAGSVSQPTFSGTAFTPSGTVSQPTFTGTAFTPAGTVSQPTFTGTEVTPAGTISSVNAVASVGTLASCTMPTFTVSNGNLTITDGSYTAGTLPTTESVTPTFTGTTFTPAGTVSQPSFTGTEVIPAGTVSQPSFTGTEVTPAGTVSQPSFTGAEATITVS